jgi:hypothetical protein
MPCSDSRAYEDLMNAEIRREHAKITAMLCAVCRELEDGKAPMIQLIPGLSAWWAEHRERDAERQKRRERDAKRNAK